jgi:hypothetical protein
MNSERRTAQHSEGQQDCAWRIYNGLHVQASGKSNPGGSYRISSPECGTPDTVSVAARGRQCNTCVLC